MALWFLILLPLFAVVESQSTNPVMNQTDLQTAIADMRAKSYHGFVILLRILNGTTNSIQNSDITFLMPNDEKLSDVSLSSDSLHEFILSHSIPTPLVYGNLLHFPNGTLVPSSLPGRMLSITNSGKAGMFVNNARIVNSNVCVNSLIKCHGISSEVAFDDELYLPLKLAHNAYPSESSVKLAHNAYPSESGVPRKKRGRAKPSLSVHPKRTPLLH